MKRKKILRNFGASLKKSMLLHGMNNKELADKTGLPYSTISLIVHGKRDPQFTTVLKILKEVPFPVHQFIDEELGRRK